MTKYQDAIAFIAEATDEVASGGPQFVGHIEGLTPPRLLEQGPGWDTPESAVVWARERAPTVRIRLGIPGTYFSAGIDDPPGDPLPRWELSAQR